MIRHTIAAVVASGVVVCGAGYAVASAAPMGAPRNTQPISRSNDGGYAQASIPGTQVAACNTGHSGDVAADHTLVGEEDLERTVVNGSRSGCVWSTTYGKKVGRYRSVMMWPGPDDYGPWVNAK